MIYDCEQELYGGTTHNGNWRIVLDAQVASRSPGRRLCLGIILRAVFDLQTFCRCGLITAKGKCLPWPRRMRMSEGKWCREFVRIGHMGGPSDHFRLKRFFHSELAQRLATSSGWRVPLVECWTKTLADYCGRDCE